MPAVDTFSMKGRSMESISTGRWGMQLGCLAMAALVGIAPAGSSQPRATEPAAAPPEPIPVAGYIGDLPEPEPDPMPQTAALPKLPRLTKGDFEFLAVHLAREYLVPLDETRQMVGTAVEIGAELKVDPLLLIGIIAVESSFNPYAVSSYGATGLMQVVPRFHENKLAPYGGEEALWDPRTNIRIGAEILVQYIRWSGTTELGLQRYNGAADDLSLAYARRVGAHLERFARAARRGTQSAPAGPAGQRT
jgi:soluble lytic murein transglycosylase-like protein